MSNPVIDLAEWIESQEDEIQADIAFIVAALHPSFDFFGMERDSSKRSELFCDRIREFSGTDIGNPGFLVSFRAIFYYAIVRKRGTAEAWEQPREFLRGALESDDPNKSEGINETTKALLSSLPERRDKWIKVCKAWENFKNSCLSDDVIERWEEKNMVNRANT